MSQQFAEGRLTFGFPDDWAVCRPEQSSFYTRHFQPFCGGCKEMDFLVYDPRQSTLWLIEVKDYRLPHQTNRAELADEIAQKTRDVLAMMPVAGIRDAGLSRPGCLQAGDFWNHARGARNVRIVLHCELPEAPSRLFPALKDAANLQTKLSQKLRCVDPRALLTNLGRAHGLPWTVAGFPA